jgi:hypothetical protein
MISKAGCVQLVDIQDVPAGNPPGLFRKGLTPNFFFILFFQATPVWIFAIIAFTYFFSTQK